MPIPTEQQLLDAACHLGHPQQKWNPKMKPYLYGVQRGVHIFDLVQTRKHLEDMVEQLKGLQAASKTILFVSTKQQSTALMEGLAQDLGQPVVTKKWIPGLLTNWKTLKRRLKYYLDLKESFRTGEVEKYTKKEQVQLRKKLAKLESALSGVAGMTGLPDALFVVDGVLDRVAVREACKLKIPVYGICDSNVNPYDFTAFIPANDDAMKSLTLILTTMKEELSGKKTRKEEDTSTELSASEPELVAA